MSRLTSHISSNYISAANSLKKNSRQRIVAYVESYDDIYFWHSVLSEFEDDKHYFEVMLPTRNGLARGKKEAIMAIMDKGGGNNLIACVDADYDYLLQRHSPGSKLMLDTPSVFHTYVYAIENYQCYAPSLHNTCVMATLNDHAIFDFNLFLSTFSEIIYPLFVWNILLYRHGSFHDFTMTDFNRTIDMGHFSIGNAPTLLDRLQHKVNVKINEVRRNHPGMKEQYDKLSAEIKALGVTPQTTYLFIQGHNLFDNIVSPMVESICGRLRSERENEIRHNACHYTQQRNELSAYMHVQADINQMLKKNTGFMRSVIYRKLRDDLEAFMEKITTLQNENK